MERRLVIHSFPKNYVLPSPVTTVVPCSSYPTRLLDDVPCPPSRNRKDSGRSGMWTAVDTDTAVDLPYFGVRRLYSTVQKVIYMSFKAVSRTRLF